MNKIKVDKVKKPYPREPLTQPNRDLPIVKTESPRSKKTNKDDDGKRGSKAQNKNDKKS